MPQQRREVKLILLSGGERTAIATGNNAAWQCVCPTTPLLIGRSEESKNMAASNRVDCPLCGRRYFVISVGPKLGAVQDVREVSGYHENGALTPPVDEPRGYGTTCGTLKPLDQVQLPDQRWAHEMMGTGGVGRAFELADLHERLSSWPLSPAVPDTVKVQFETANNLMLYAWFVFEFQTVAEMQAYTALELALRKRLGNPTRQNSKGSEPKPLMLFDLLARAVSQNLVVPEKLPSWEWVQVRHEHRSRLAGVQASPLSAVEWLQGLKEVLPDLRNDLAHGNFKLNYHNSFARMELCGDIINQLFP